MDFFYKKIENKGPAAARIGIKGHAPLSQFLNSSFILQLRSGYQNNNSIDIVVKGVSKGTGVKAIKKHLNADEMLGIGDSYYDLPLFKASDYSFTFHSSATQNVIKYTHIEIM